MKRRARGNIQVLALVVVGLALALLGVACKKDECLKALDHLDHLSYVEAMKSLDQVAPEMRAEAARIMPSEDMMRQQMRELGVKRFGARCHDPAFTKCVLAAQNLWGIAQCEHP